MRKLKCVTHALYESARTGTRTSKVVHPWTRHLRPDSAPDDWRIAVQLIEEGDEDDGGLPFVERRGSGSLRYQRDQFDLGTAFVTDDWEDYASNKPKRHPRLGHPLPKNTPWDGRDRDIYGDEVDAGSARNYVRSCCRSFCDNERGFAHHALILACAFCRAPQHACKGSFACSNSSQ